MRRAFTNLTLDERRTIAKLLQAKTPRVRIAEILGRDPWPRSIDDPARDPA